MPEQSESGSWRIPGGLQMLFCRCWNPEEAEFYRAAAHWTKLPSRLMANKQIAKFFSTVSFQVSCPQRAWPGFRTDLSVSKNLIWESPSQEYLAACILDDSRYSQVDN